MNSASGVEATVRQRVFSDSPSFCFAGLDVILCGSPDVCFVLVLPYSVIYPPFPIIYMQLGFSGRSSGVRLRLSVVPNFFCVRQCPLVAVGSPFSFFRFSSWSVLPLEVIATISSGFFLPVRLSVLSDCILLHAALLFLLSIRLFRSCFGASNTFLAIRCLCRVLLFGFSLPLPVLVSGSFHLRDATFFACLCVSLRSFPSVSLSVVEFLFHLLFVFVGLASDVSSSCFCVILVS